MDRPSQPRSGSRSQARVTYAVLCLLSFTASSLCAHPTRAADTDAISSVPRIKTLGCPQLDSEKLRQSIALEVQVAGINANVANLDLNVRCGPTITELEVADRQHAERLRRQLPASRADGPANERTLALAAVELIEALVFAGPRKKAERETTSKKAGATFAERQPVTKVRETMFEVDVDGSVKWRSFGAPLTLAVVAIEGRLRVGERVWVGIGGAREWGEAKRSVGAVKAVVVGGFLSARVRLLEVGLLGFDLDGHLASSLVQLTGKPGDVNVTGAKAKGWGFDAALGGIASVELRPMELGILGRIGTLFPRAQALVEGARDVGVGGEWVEFGVVAGVNW